MASRSSIILMTQARLFLSLLKTYAGRLNFMATGESTTMTKRVLLAFADELEKIAAGGGLRAFAPKVRSAGKWVSREIVAPALPTAILAVLANAAVEGANALSKRLVSSSAPTGKKKKKRKKRSVA
jgi:hypothetical protein